MFDPNRPRQPVTVSRSYNFDALTSAGVGVPSETLRLGDPTGRIYSVTIDNGSNCIAGVYLDRDPVGVPNYQIPAGTYKTQPVNATIIGVAFMPPVGDQPRGSAYVQGCDQMLSASSGVSASSANASFVWDSSLWDSGAKLS